MKYTLKPQESSSNYFILLLFCLLSWIYNLTTPLTNDTELF